MYPCPDSTVKVFRLGTHQGVYRENLTVMDLRIKI